MSDRFRRRCLALLVYLAPARDALSLASRGWLLTAVDVSPAAMDQARQAAEATDSDAAARVTCTPHRSGLRGDRP